MFKNHIWAEDQPDAISKTRNQHPHLQIRTAYLDSDWGKNPHRWCVEVDSATNGDAAEAARQTSDYRQYLRDTGDAA